ncbi:antitoxin VapB family protein [Halorhabdus amylolytica]|nr:antitoxin VapB family protein [Halorhabdus amylolytica]
MPSFGTNIRVTSETYRHLEQRKRDDESFDDTLKRALGLDDAE